MTSRPGAVRTAGAALVCALTLTFFGPPAAAQDAAGARAQAQAAAAAVRALSGRLQAAQAQYDAALANVGQQVTASVLAQSRQDDLRQVAQRAADDQANTARALYMSGGQNALVSTLLGSTDAQDLADRLAAIDRVLQVAQSSVVAADRARTAARAQAVVAARAADASVVTASVVAQRAAAVDVLFAQAQAQLDRLSARARRMTEAEQAAKALARVQAEAAAAGAAAIGSVRAQAPPAAYLALYHAAAATCPGLSWTLLAAVGQVESGHGRNNGPSSAGAIGPMQFMPGTFALYGVDGDRNGRLDPWSPADAIYTAARYLCSNGAGTPTGVQRALLAYNNAQWYVDLVLSVQAQFASPAVEGLRIGG